MKTLSSYNDDRIDRLQIDVVRLVVITWSGLTVRLCDRVWGDDGSQCIFDGNTYDCLIQSIGPFRQGRIDWLTWHTTGGEGSVSIDNTQPVAGEDRFSDLFSTYDPHFADIEIQELLLGGSGGPSSGDEISIFKGQIEDVSAMTPETVALALSGLEMSILNQFSIEICNDTDYAGADPDDIGKMFPEVWGRCSRVPLIAIDAGGITTIVDDMTSGSPTNGGTLRISDGTAFPTGAFILQIDAEQISIASRSNYTLTLAASGARGYGGTTAAPHDAGAACGEIQSTYLYAIAHPVNAVSAVYVDGVRQSGNYSVYTGQPGSQHGTYNDRAVVQFNSLPQIVRQANLSLTDPGVTDTINFEDNDGHQHSQYRYAILYAEAIQSNNGTLYPEEALGYGTEASNHLEIGLAASDYTYLEFHGTKDFGGDPKEIRIGVVYRMLNAPGGTQVTIQFQDQDDNVLTTLDTGLEATQTWLVDEWDTLTNKSWADISGGRFYLDYKTGYVGSANCCYIWAVWIEVKYEEDTAYTTLDKGGVVSHPISLDGNSVADSVIGQLVTADLIGYQDDGSGTYTGTPNSIIENPADVLRHMLIAKCGLTTSELDSTAYSAARSALSTLNYRSSVCLLEKPVPRVLFAEIARQAKCLQWWDAGKHFVEMISATPTTDKTLDKTRIDFERLNPPVRLSYTDRAAILNTLKGRYWRYFDRS